MEHDGRPTMSMSGTQI